MISEEKKEIIFAEVNRMTSMEKELRLDPSKLDFLSNQALASIRLIVFIRKAMNFKCRKFFLVECEKACPAMFAHGIEFGVRQGFLDDNSVERHETWQMLRDRMRATAVRKELAEVVPVGEKVSGRLPARRV